jgi:hypothetical protein
MAAFAEAPWPDGVAPEGLDAGVRADAALECGVAAVVDGVEAVVPACGEVAQAESASTAPRPSDAAIRCVVRIEKTRGTR